MLDEEDQVQGSESNESEADKVGTEKVEDTQETSEQEQSNKEKVEKEEEVFELPDGRKVDAKTLSKEWKENFYPEFTRRSQKLSEFQKTEQERQAQAETEARKTVGDKVAPEVREAIVNIVKPEFLAWQNEQERLQAQREEDRQFEQKLSDLEAKYDGKNGLPKFDRIEVLRAMQEKSNKNFEPSEKFYGLHREEFEEAKVKEALKKKSGSLSTEATGQESERKPEGKTPRTFSEASTRAYSRLQGEQ